MRIIEAAADAKRTFSIFLLIGTICVSLRAWKKNSKLNKTIEMAVAIAAPSRPSSFRINKICFIGMKIIFSTRFTAAAKEIFNKNNLDFPVIATRLCETTNKEENREPTAKILRAFAAINDASPNSILRAVPGKKISKSERGRFIIKIHLETCLLSSFMRFIFFREYSLVIRGMNNCINKSGATVIRRAIGTAVLYTPTANVDLKNPRLNESIQ